MISTFDAVSTASRILVTQTSVNKCVRVLDSTCHSYRLHRDSTKFVQYVHYLRAVDEELLRFQKRERFVGKKSMRARSAIASLLACVHSVAIIAQSGRE